MVYKNCVLCILGGDYSVVFIESISSEVSCICIFIKSTNALVAANWI